MECFDTAVTICSYLSQCEAMEFANVSRLCRRAAQVHVGPAEFRYFTGECTREDHIELAPPCRVLGLMFVEPSHQLVVLGRSDVCSGDVECILYIQEYVSNGGRREHRIELPASFASLACAPQFEGHRFLCGITNDDVAVVFDCTTEMQLEVPFGMEAFHASPSGSMCVVDVDRHLYFCETAHCISIWWEMQQTKTVLGRSGLVSTAPPAPTRLRGQLTVSHAAHQHPLGNSSAAWHNCWVGDSSVMYAHEGGVTLFLATTPPAKSFTTPAADATGAFDTASGTVTEGIAFKAIELSALSTACSVLSNSSRSEVAVLPSGGDEYVFLTCRNFRLYVVRTCRGRPFPPYDHRPDAPFESLSIDLQPLLPLHCGVKGIAIVDPGRVYMAHVQYAHEDHVLFFSSDLTMHRWVAVGRPSYLALHRGAGVLITAPLDLAETTSDHHLLLEVVEGGVGSVIHFANPTEATISAHISSDRSAEVAVMAATAGNSSRGDLVNASGFCSWLWSNNRESAALSGVEALSWVAFGIVSASLIWTLSALCYNGWWLHLQLLFCGKIA